MRYVYAGETGEMEENPIRRVDGIDRVPTALVLHKGEYFAVSGICNHKGGRIWEGRVLDNGFIECPWHRAYYRLSDGKHAWCGSRSLRTFPVKVEGTSIYIGVAEPEK
jgi:nitrite reductase/ring-hydroxylating ferredoxin subunit